MNSRYLRKRKMGNMANSRRESFRTSYKDEVVMPFDKTNRYKNNAGKSMEKWNFLLNCFGSSNPLDKFGTGWKQTAQLIQKTNPKHYWNLTGLEHYKSSTHIKMDKRMSIFEHLQDTLEQSENTLRNVTPLKFLSIPVPQTDEMMEQTRSFSSKQVEALLIFSLFCMFPYRNSGGAVPSINFNRLYLEMDRREGRRPEAARAKMDCVWQYFATRAYEQKNKIPERQITFTRRSMVNYPDWEKETGQLSNVFFSHLPMEDQEGPILEVDFANKVIGGGVLGSGAVQEEIRMAVAPEMIVARLFTEPLQDHEVLFINGAKIFSKTSGYSDSLTFDGFYEDLENNRKVVAMDAKDYKDPSKQYKRHEVLRELNKAFCAFFTTEDQTKIATGHWGCGAFGGDKELKSVIQLLAASKAERDLVYCLPGANFQQQFDQTLRLLRAEKATIGMVFRAIVSFDPDEGSLFKWLERNFNSTRSKSSNQRNKSQERELEKSEQRQLNNNQPVEETTDLVDVSYKDQDGCSPNNIFTNSQPTDDETKQKSKENQPYDPSKYTERDDPKD